MTFHAKVASTSYTPCEFRTLNNSHPILIGADISGNDEAMTQLLETFEESPCGRTPLCHHIREVTAIISNMAPHLRHQNKRVALIIATDGKATDGNVSDALKPLERLPVWVVIRLCTDNNGIVDYWNRIESELELDMDVLDDFVGEAKEIYAHNSFLTYGEPLHRLREFGVFLKEIDLLDEAKLTAEQRCFICSVM